MRLFKERDDKLKVDVEFFEWFLLDSPENKINYQSAHSNINRLNEELGNTGKIISDLLEFRRNILKEFELLRAKESLQDNDRCPLCDSKFDTYDGLIQSIDLRTKKLEEFNRLRLEEVEKSKKTIESISSDIQKHIENYIKSNVQLIDALVQLLPNLQNSLSMVLGHIEKLPKEIVPDLQKYKFINFPKSHEELDNKRQELKNHVTTLTDENYKYIPEKIEGVSLFEKYFNSEKDQFEAVTIENLNEKKKFLYHVFKEESDEHLSFLKTRKEELNKIISSTEKVSEKLGQAILDYQKSIVNRIKVPFFIYSGKILQSYQQGSGIFISTEGTGKGTRIGFRTGVRSDHDIVYHLSAGQLSAVALAFILALNKVYGANKNFKFLAIDDPIQTMDDLNMHTFVELLRNDFSGYQILLSTHDDYVASYMKYKFEKEGINTEVTDVHEKLWSSSVS